MLKRHADGTSSGTRRSQQADRPEPTLVREGLIKVHVNQLRNGVGHRHAVAAVPPQVSATSICPKDFVEKRIRHCCDDDTIVAA